MDTTALLNALVDKKNISAKDASEFLSALMKGEVMPVQAGAILTALRMKGETTDEIVGFVKAMRTHMVPVAIPDAIDIVGTGGDGSGTFNVSTAAAFVVAGAGVLVAKHGNRAASSRCGSADVLEALGVKIELSANAAARVAKQAGIVFLFAPLFHPATKQVVAVRKELKIRTIFNVLGPFANPASVKRELMGVPSPAIAQKLAQVARALDYKRILLVSSEDGLDEISLSAKTHAIEVRGKKIRKFIIDPLKLGFKKAKKSEVLGGDTTENARIIRGILAGEKGPRRDITLLNSAFALVVAGAARDVKEAMVRVEKSIDSGKAKNVLERLIDTSNSL